MKEFRKITDYAGTYGLPATYKKFNITADEYVKIIRVLVDASQENMRKVDKQCTKCMLQKPFTHFGPHPSRSDGIQSWCRHCIANRCVAKEKKVYGSI